jgi:hypothetical protein
MKNLTKKRRRNFERKTQAIGEKLYHYKHNNKHVALVYVKWCMRSFFQKNMHLIVNFDDKVIVLMDSLADLHWPHKRH